MVREPTKTVPPGARTIARAPGSPCAQSSTENPSGTRSCAVGMRSAGVAMRRGGCGARGEPAISGGRPWAQAGGAAGGEADGAGDACCACAKPGHASAAASAR